MKKTIKHLSFILILLLAISACHHREEPSIANNLCGHIVFLHIGEEDKIIWTLMILTGGDTSYLDYKKLDKRLNRENFVLTFTLPRECIKIDNDSIYRTVKDYLIHNMDLRYLNQTPELRKSAIENSKYGTFKVIIDDSRDSLGLVIPYGQVAQAFFSGLLKITKKYNNENLTERLSEYERMQSVWLDNKK